MGKYIIDVPDEGKYRLGQAYIFANDGERIAVSCNLADLTPYTEPDKEQIENEVWGFASMLMNMHHDVAEDIYWSMNGGKGIEVAAEMTYQEAKAKYEKWKAEMAEIRVGDEVCYVEDHQKKIVVTNTYSDGFDAIDNNGNLYIRRNPAMWKNTGRHFDEIEELLKKMGED